MSMIWNDVDPTSFITPELYHDLPIMHQTNLPYKFRVELGVVEDVVDIEERKQRVRDEIVWPDTRSGLFFEYVVELLALGEVKELVTSCVSVFESFDHDYDYEDIYVIMALNKDYVISAEDEIIDCSDGQALLIHHCGYNYVMEKLIKRSDWWNDKSIPKYKLQILWTHVKYMIPCKITTEMILQLVNYGVNPVTYMIGFNWRSGLDKDRIYALMAELDVLHFFKGFSMERRLELELPYDCSAVWNEYLSEVWEEYQMVDIWSAWTKDS